MPKTLHVFVPGLTDLGSLRPDILSMWHKDNEVQASELTLKSNKKIKLLCERGHTIENSVSKFTEQEKIYCARCNSLINNFPDVAKEWSDKNDIRPDQVSKTSGKKVWWRCSKGHEWQSKISNRTSLGRGCPYCSGRIVDLPTRNILTNSSLAAEWADKSDPYTVSISSKHNYIWRCEKGHEYPAAPLNRSKGTGCPVCSGRNVNPGVNDLLTCTPELTKEWSTRNKIQPSEVTRASSKKVLWSCSTCSFEWEASVANRSTGSGCPRCFGQSSLQEKELSDYIHSIFSEEIILHDRKVISPYELDIYIPSRKIAIEFNGVFWHAESNGKDKNYHRNKWKLCSDKGIQLITVWEDDWQDKKQIIKKMLARKLGISTETRIYARNTTVGPITKDQAAQFLLLNHIQGFVGGSYYIGLSSTANDLVGVAVFKREKNNLTLSRYATNCLLIGGHSKIISWVQNNIKFDRLITFADLEVSTGRLYEETGWMLDRVLAPDYKYVLKSKRAHKFKFRLKRFREDPNLKWQENLTEKELAELNNLHKVWDCGKLRYIMDKKEKNDSLS